ncbi:glutathione S-transferase [Shewanella sp. OPT22]|nr:glutathione S-transferase [Shewanella sp. OPT22]
MIKIISFKICPFVQRVTAALEAKNIAYEIEFISLKDKPKWFIDVSPNGQVPVMVTENHIPLFESDAIIEYIEDEYGALEENVTNEQRALDRAWSYLASKNYLVQCSTMRSKDESIFTERFSKLRNAFEKAENQLNIRNQFFKSDRISNVDLAWLPLLYRANIVQQHMGCDLLVNFPKMKAWQANLLALPFASKTVSHDFETLFSNFYLTDTFLAQCKSEKINSQCCDTSSCC